MEHVQHVLSPCQFFNSFIKGFENKFDKVGLLEGLVYHTRLACTELGRMLGGWTSWGSCAFHRTLPHENSHGSICCHEEPSMALDIIAPFEVFLLVGGLNMYTSNIFTALALIVKAKK
eukprot:3053850-Amphidinium_carterae.1